MFQSYRKCINIPGDVEIFPYFYGPVGVLLLINLILFAATAHELTCGLWKREVVKSNTERYGTVHSV
jgi:G protein-coupled receptor Mth (Methuselah protein)